MSQWFGGMRPGSAGEAQIDLRVGGRYRIVSRVEGGETHDVSGEYLEVLPHRRLVFTWAWHSTPERASRITIDFAEQDGGTAVSFVHDRFFDDQARANHERGWQPGFERLGDYLQSQHQEA